LPAGEKILARLTELHQREVRRFQLGILSPSGTDAAMAEKTSAESAGEKK